MEQIRTSCCSRAKAQASEMQKYKANSTYESTEPEDIETPIPGELTLKNEETNQSGTNTNNETDSEEQLANQEPTISNANESDRRKKKNGKLKELKC